MVKTIITSKVFFLVAGIYIILLLWWLKIFFSGVVNTDEGHIFGAVYAIIAIIGGANGLYVSRKWGGWNSTIGRGIIFFSLGLIGEWFGQTTWAYFNIIAKQEVPYPSIADIGFFSIIPLYSLGMLSFAKAAGAKFSIQTVKGKLLILFVPLVMVVFSYFFFLKNVTPDFSDLLRTFLDFGYPLGEAIPICIALITFELSRGILGGKMRNRILYLIFALIFQFITEYTFIYTAATGTYYNAGPVDLMYMTSFAIMSIGLVSLKNYD